MDEIIDYIMATPENTNPNVLRGVLENNNSSLPSITADDNGKVLTVVNGAWDKAQPSGSFIINATNDGETGAHVLDKTWNEINTVFGNGVICIILEQRTDGFIQEFVAQTMTIEEEEIFTIATFSGTNYSTNSAEGYPSHIEENMH